MKRATLWVLIATVGGFISATFVARSIDLREKLGAFFGRGHLLAFVRGYAIYQGDVDRALAESRDLAGIEGAEPTLAEQETALAELIAGAAAQSHGASEKISRAKVNRDLNLLRSQFSDEKTWRAALNRSELSIFSLGQSLKGDLRARRWIAQHIAPELEVTEGECRRFYDSHLHDFFLPARSRVSHLFLAAPPESSPEIVEAKKTAIERLSTRLASGEDFGVLVAQNSEDEATKLNGGDLGYFSAIRMPPDFVEAAIKLKPGEIGKPTRTRLGFHILKLVDTQPARQQSFEETRNDIALELANQKRSTAMQKLDVDLRRAAGPLKGPGTSKS
jgi:parvulin-like peptidyl-prolyl isomerase